MKSTNTKAKTPNPLKLPKIYQKRAPCPLLELKNKDTIFKASQPKTKLAAFNKKQQPHNRMLSKPSSDTSTNSSSLSSKTIKMTLNQPQKHSITSQQTIISKQSSSTSLNHKKTQQNNQINSIKKPAVFPKITWLDFQGRLEENTWFLAHIYWYISYDFKPKEKSPIFKVAVNVNCYINKDKSWVKNKYDELLEHEQGHYNIGYLAALMFQRRVKRTLFNQNNYKEEIRKMFNETMREYCEMEKQYDDETYHMLNKEMQIKWNEDLQKKLQELID